MHVLHYSYGMMQCAASTADRHRLLGVLRVKSHAHWMVVQVVKGMRDRRRAGDGKQI